MIDPWAKFDSFRRSVHVSQYGLFAPKFVMKYIYISMMEENITRLKDFLSQIAWSETEADEVRGRI